MPKIRTRVLAAFLLLVATACTDRKELDGDRVAENEKGIEIAKGESESTAPPRVQSIEDRRLRGSNTSEALSRLTEQQQNQVLEFYSRFGDSVFRFARREQLDWMIDRYYPMPDDILEAATLDDQRLKSMSDGGDLVATFFYYDRLLAEIDAAATQGDPSYRLQERVELERRLLASGSPFAGYAMARGARVTGGVATEMAAYAWAGHFGDWRGFEEALRAARAANDVEASAMALAEFSVLLKSSSLARPGFTQKVVIPFPHDMPDPRR